VPAPVEHALDAAFETLHRRPAGGAPAASVPDADQDGIAVHRGAQAGAADEEVVGAAAGGHEEGVAVGVDRHLADPEPVLGRERPELVGMLGRLLRQRPELALERGDGFGLVAVAVGAPTACVPVVPATGRVWFRARAYVRPCAAGCGATLLLRGPRWTG